ncbi:signal recognition particle-docking protein FtsY [Corynebacterium uropygiale]|uniref:Signal recognition particle receptor FtsY n=1 Tax=Corynebacterium uropygiale TaxID=1775911 RepID=A0A9X1TXP6_9CORY|nr:signal recognition particle-docking protein FtsY [Corynebacterium uropygiale]MCF4006350.1 signal recognition particle-docking protein FtsY [Corynebacterium uropygiale]
MINTPTLIIVVVAIIIVVVALLLIWGNHRRKSKLVSFEKPADEAPKQLTQQEKSGNYQAHGGFQFAPAAPGTQQKKEPVLRDDQKLPETPAPKEAQATPVTPPAPEPAPAPEPEPQLEPEVRPEPQAEPEPEQPAEAAEPEQPAEPVEETKPVAHEPEPIEEPTEEPAPASDLPSTAEKPENQPASSPEEGTAALGEQPEEEREPQPEAIDEPAPEPEPEPTPAEDEAEAQEAAAAAVAAAESAAAAKESTPAPEPEPEEEQADVVETPAQPQEDIAPAAGRLGRLRGRLSRSQNAIGKSVLGILSAGDLDEDAWEDIEDTLYMADLGAVATEKVMGSLRSRIAEQGVSSEAEARAMLRACLIEACKPEMDRSIRAVPSEGKPAVVLVVGVNGTGKTTTVGKLARVLVSMGHSVLLGAADTFRAAAADQLETWGRRVGATTVRGAEGADPASVAFDAVAKGVEERADVVVVDTAGRLHTSKGLMDQLGKVKRVVEKKAQVDEVLLVLDATVGQNGLMQARIFRDVVDISGVVLTKLDGTAKGGIVFQVQEELGVPVKLVGLGEGADDLAPFEVEGFVDALLG